MCLNDMFSLTSFHCRQHYNYTAGDKKQTPGPLYSTVSHHKNKTAVRPRFLHFLDKFSLSISAVCQFFSLISALVKEKQDKFFFTHQQIKFSKSEVVNANLLVCKRLNMPWFVILVSGRGPLNIHQFIKLQNMSFVLGNIQIILFNPPFPLTCWRCSNMESVEII